MISSNELDPNFQGPGFSMRDYLSSLYTKISVYKDPTSLSEAYDVKKPKRKGPLQEFIKKNWKKPFGGV